MKHRSTTANTKDGRSAITAAALATLPLVLAHAARDLKTRHGVKRFGTCELRPSAYQFCKARDIYADALEVIETTDGVAIVSVADHTDHPSARGKTYLTVIIYN